uniref:Neurogenic locus notch homolog protein 1 n=1 Tax=Cyprinus carpio TaxID=7962 RepID=A0A8C1RD89_CYPCA
MRERERERERVHVTLCGLLIALRNLDEFKQCLSFTHCFIHAHTHTIVPCFFRCPADFVGPQCQFPNPCSPSPCRNGGVCRARTQGNDVELTCDCVLGYSGPLCLTPVNHACMGSPCRNGGTCSLLTLETFTCRCSPGWSGKTCQQADPCASNPCANGGQCSAFESHYICTCPPNFHGQTCRQDVNECALSPSPCRNGGTCKNEVGSYLCLCPPEYAGTHCERLYHPCHPSPCRNGGTCLQTSDTTYACTCLPGFTGQTCEHNVDDCTQHACENGGRCIDGVNTYNCHCDKHWTGQYCTEDVDECELSPNACQNGGTCHNTIGGFHCVCVNGWTGDDCSENIDDCASAACSQGATCHDRVASFFCECPHGRTGTSVCALTITKLLPTGLLCHLDDACISANPCEHGGRCLNTKGSFQCRCLQGYEGVFCQINTDDCASQPCLNNGKCIDKINSFHCECPKGFSGNLCQVDVDECASTPCKNGAKCTDGPNKYTCECTPGFAGAHCELDINECASSPCHYGVCRDGVAAFTCDCRPGYTGRLCETNINECLSQPCRNGGTCQDRENAYTCTCPKGTTGMNCEINIDDCKSKPCDYGKCIDKINGYECVCEPGYTGSMCNINIDDCALNPCHNGGTCIDGINSFTCLCPEGFRDATCLSKHDECSSNPCIHGNCLDQINSYRCMCEAGWTGRNCDININECLSNPCMNGGTCKDMTSGYVCTCRAGFSGPNCQTNINECASNPCLNQGTCIDDVAGFKCNCMLPYTGEVCERVLAPCAQRPCKNGGVCVESEDFQSFSCACPAGWQGQTCEVDINECVRNPCTNGGVCENLRGGYKCRCNPGFSGDLCQNDIDDCEPNPCSNGGVCQDRVDGFVCVCLAGFRGERCAEDIDECVSAPCRNGGNCTDCVNSYTCSCPVGFSGINCEINTPDCTESSCFNGGTCVDGINSFSCVCLPGFTGNYCQHDVNECDSRPCQNGGTCQDGYGTYKCTCPHGYTGLNCQSLVRWCDSFPCKNGGSCWQQGASFTCQCASGWTGIYCDVPSVSCEVAARQQGVSVAVLCRNAGQCVDVGNTHLCRCQAGYTGSYCQEQVDECMPNPCQNGATCTDYLGGYSCERCETVFNGCKDTPCKNGGTCAVASNTKHGYICKCQTGYSGSSCEYDFLTSPSTSSSISLFSPLYDQYCRDHYADGHCDQGCNNAECEWDGLDCADDVPQKLAVGSLVLVVHIPPDELRNRSSSFLRELSGLLHTNVVFRRDANGEMLIFPYYGNEHELSKHKRSDWTDPAQLLQRARRSLTAFMKPRLRRELDQMEIKGSIVYLEIDNRQCYQQSDECFQSATDVAAFLGALASSGNLNVPYIIEAVTSECHIYAKIRVLLLCRAVGVVVSRKRKREHGQLWFPDGFKVTEPKKKRREPVGEDSVGLKPLKNSLMDEQLSEWAEDDTAKRFQFEEQSILDMRGQLDHRQWTQQHLDAADLRLNSMAPTPPQGEIENDCMDVNVRGPDGFTPLMIASCSGGGLENENGEADDDPSAEVINDFIYHGANLHNQTDRTGETALHLAARYARSDAAKRLLESCADANVQDNMGRTPLHAAVAADAQGVFQILIRNRATDLDARMHDGTTPLILATRLAVEGMVEELINCHADPNATDDSGKSALHWAAAVNNVDAAVILLKNRANKDLQNNKEETPLFLAAREGSYETAKVLLDHLANREIADHLDQLPRDIAQERMHHDIVRLLEEYSLVQSPTLPLSPPLCSPNTYLGIKPSPGGANNNNTAKKARKQGGKGVGGKDGGKDMRMKKKKSGEGKNGGITEVGILSPVDSLESPHGYLSDVSSPPTMTSPFQQSPPITLNQLQGLADSHMGGALQSLGKQFDSAPPPRLSHMPVPNNGGGAQQTAACDWLQRVQHQQQQAGFTTLIPTMLSATNMPQVMGYPTMQSSHLGAPSHMIHNHTHQNMPPMQHQNSATSIHALSHHFLGDLSGLDLQSGSGHAPIQTILSQESQRMAPPISSTQFLTPPSQHSYSNPMDNTPSHQQQIPDHPFLTPSPGSPDQWSSSSPHSNLSDWSEGISSPPTSMQMNHIPEAFK